MGDGFDGDELMANVTYRVAYGEACRIVEVLGRHSGHGLEAEAMARDIGRRLGVEPAAIVEAVEDALAGRRPRW
jgi:hypothetical protein